jgi:hypothetical protein
MRRDRDRDRGEPWVNMGQQRNPAPRFASKPEYSETPDPLGQHDWDGEGDDFI